MKKQLVNIISLTLLCLLIAFGIWLTHGEHKHDWRVPVQTKYETTLRVVSSINYEPVSYYNSDKMPSGYNIELIYILSEKLKANIQLDMRVWSEAFEAFENGQYDIIMGVTYDAGNEAIINYSLPFFTEGHTIFGPNAENIGVAELFNHRIATLEGDSIKYTATNFYSLQNTIIALPTYEDCFTALANGECDYVIAPKTTGYCLINRLGLEGIETGSDIIHSSMLCLGTQPENAELGKKINRALYELGEDGTLNRLYNKWMIDHVGLNDPINVLSRYTIHFMLIGLLIVSAFLILMVYYETKRNRMLVQQSHREHEINALNLKLDTALYGIGGGFVIFSSDYDATISFISKAAASILGYSVEELLAVSDGKARNIVHPDDFIRFHSEKIALANVNDTFSIKYRVRCKNGEYKWLSNHGKIILNENGERELYSFAYDVSELEEKRITLKKTSALLQSIYDTVPCGILRLSRKNGVFSLVSINNAAVRLLNYTNENVYSQDWSSGVATTVLTDDANNIIEAYENLKYPGDVASVSYRVGWNDGSVHLITGNTTLVSCDDDEQIFQRMVYDDTDRFNTFSELQERISLDNAVFSAIRALSHERDIQTAMNAFLQTIGSYYQAERAYIFEFDYSARVSRNTYEWCAEGISSEIEILQNVPLSYVENWLTSFKNHEPVYISLMSEQEQSEMNSMLAVGIYQGDDVIGLLGVDSPKAFSDNATLLNMISEFVTEEIFKRFLTDNLEGINFTDRLTGLYNRSKYIQTLEYYTKDPPSSMGVFFVDLDGLHDVNEKFGHDTGDKFICYCSDMIRDVASDVFRLDGDEFVVMLPNITESRFGSIELELRDKLKQMPFGSASLGAVWESGDINIFEMVSTADDMMYAEKQVYYRSFNNSVEEYALGAAGNILRDIEECRFEVLYQPQIKLCDGSLFGAEALVRKISDDGSLILPDKFVPLYEAQGVIAHMDLYVLEQVCIAMRCWLEEFNAMPKISVNFSRITLMEDGIVLRVCDICDQYQIPHSNIMI